MKIFTLFIPLLCSPLMSFAQFEPAIILQDGKQLNEQILSGDLDNDGDTDLLVWQRSFPTDRLAYAENLGNAVFDTVRPFDAVQDSFPDITDVVLTDIDGVNGADVLLLAGGGWENHMRAYYNDGLGNFQLHIIDSLLFPSVLESGDFNNDGRTDILLVDDHRVKLYFQTGQGQFDTSRVVFGTTEFYALTTLDANGDGLLDFVVSSSGFELLLNQGDSTFTLTDSEGHGFPFGLWAKDYDDDGDEDIFSWSHGMGLQLFGNNGSGDLHLKETITTLPDNFTSATFIDADKDDDIDMITTISQLGQAIWYENINDTFADTPHIIHQHAGQLMHCVSSGDYNNDGLEDVSWGSTNLGVNLQSSNISTTQRIRNEASIQLYPNPSEDGYFYLLNHSADEREVMILDSQGRIIRKWILAPGNSRQLHEKLVPGIYSIFYTGRAGEGMLKFIVR